MQLVSVNVTCEPANGTIPVHGVAPVVHTRKMKRPGVVMVVDSAICSTWGTTAEADATVVLTPTGTSTLDPSGMKDTLTCSGHVDAGVPKRSSPYRFPDP